MLTTIFMNNFAIYLHIEPAQIQAKIWEILTITTHLTPSSWKCKSCGLVFQSFQKKWQKVFFNGNKMPFSKKVPVCELNLVERRSWRYPIFSRLACSHFNYKLASEWWDYYISLVNIAHYDSFIWTPGTSGE